LWTVKVSKIETTIVSKTRIQRKFVSLGVGSSSLVYNINKYAKFSGKKSTTYKLVKFEESLREGILTQQMTKYAVEV